MEFLFSTMATVSIKMIETVGMIPSALAFTPKLTFAEGPDGMLAFDTQKIPTMGSFDNFFSISKYGSGENKVNYSNSMGCEVKCRTIIDASLLASNLFGQRCSSKKSVPQLNPQTFGAFPLDEQGKLLDKDVLRDGGYQHLLVKENREIIMSYKNIKDGVGKKIVMSNKNIKDGEKSEKVYKLMIHYNLHKKDPVLQNSMDSKDPKGLLSKEKKDPSRSPKEVLMCDPMYGEEFAKGIQDMRVGGIRRIIVHKDWLKNLPEDLPKDLNDYAVFDVELVDVCPSRRCCFKATV